VVAVAALLAAAGHAMGQPAAPYSGESFARVDLPLTPRPLDLALESRRAWAWRSGRTDRLLLDRDVRVRIGPTSLRAARAMVWIEPVALSTPDGRTIAGDQVAVVLEDARNAIGSPATALDADLLLVTAVITGEVAGLRTDLLVDREPATQVEFRRRAEARFARLLTELTGSDTPSAGALPPLPDRSGLPAAARPPAVLPDAGSIGFYAERIESTGDADERAIVLTDGAIVQVSFPGEVELAQLTAERAVVFLAEGADADATRFDLAGVRGVYLEGDLRFTDGRATLRGERAYYDPRTNRAVAFDAVFFTYDERRGMPVYLRAGAIRQLAEDQWRGEDATLANVAFAEPHFSIGADEITISDVGRGETPTVEIEDLSLRAGGVSLLSLPRYSGELEPSALREVTVGRRRGDNLIETRWDLFTLLGLDQPEGNRAELLADGYFERGPAGGVDLDWTRRDMRGSLFGYSIWDNGKDRLSSGASIDRDNEFRGAVLFDNIWNITDEWSLFLEATYISDETFVDALFNEWGATRREFASSAFLRRVEDQEVVSIEARGTFNDFIPNEYLLQSRGYQVQRLPEFRYARVGEQVFDLLSYTGEASIGRYELRFHEPTLAETGLDNERRASAAFPGLTPADSVSDALRAAGLTESTVARFDTRHEIELPLRSGPSYLVPFATGRFTAYDNDFSRFRDSDNDDQYRVWGSVGVRAGTSLVRVNNAAGSEFFDVDRLRHVVEPSVTFWYAATNLGPDEFPVYDENVEAINDGVSVRAGMTNTWQTMRGPDGDKRSVDWITLRTDYVYSNRHTPVRSIYGRFLDARPENSTLGEYAVADLSVLVTDALTVVGDLVYSFDERATARATGGFALDHGYGYTSFVDVRHLGPGTNDTILRGGARYELTTKYAVEFRVVWDLDENDFRSADATIERRFQQWTAVVSVGFDDIADLTSLSMAIRPVGFGPENRRRVFTYEDSEVIYNAAPGALREDPTAEELFRR
jgi:hypothetical protein